MSQFLTLSELIEACGQNFLGLELLDKHAPRIDVGEHPEVKEWATIFHAMSRATTLNSEIIHAYGTTPEEAKAKLRESLE